MAIKKLTNSATLLTFKKLELAGFTLLQPLEALGPGIRWVYVLTDIHAALRSGKSFQARAEAETTIAWFSAGLIVTVSCQRARSADLKPVEGTDHVWSMAFRKPKPGGRLLGVFAARDVFVGLGLYHRDELGGAAYGVEGLKAQQRWEDETAGMDRVRSLAANDVLTGIFRDLDKKEDNA